MKQQFGRAFEVETETYSLPAIVKGFMGDEACVFTVPNSQVIDLRRPSSASDMGSSSEKSSQHSSHGVASPAPIAASAGSAAVNTPSVSVTHALTVSPSPPLPAAPAVAVVDDLTKSRDLDFHVMSADRVGVPDGFRFWAMHKNLAGPANPPHQRYFVVDSGVLRLYQWSIPTVPFGKDLKS